MKLNLSNANFCSSNPKRTEQKRKRNNNDRQLISITGNNLHLIEE